MAGFDPIYFAPIATSGGVAVTLALWLLNQRNKEFSYEILSDTPLVSLAEEVSEDVQIMFKGQAVHEVRLVVIRLVNSGQIPIKAGHFEGDMEIGFGEGAKVLMAEVLQTNPANLLEGDKLKDSLSAHDNSVVKVRPMLLNSKDSVTLKCLVSSKEKSITVRARIEGISSIKQTRDNPVFPIVLANLGSMLMVTSLFFLDPESIFRGAVMDFAPYLLFFLIGYIMLMSGIYLPRRPSRGISIGASNHHARN